MTMFDSICGRVAPGMCRLSMNGEIAVRTRAGYRSWDPVKRRLTNCDSFVMDVGEDWFFVVPTNRVRPGDIILAGGTPRCVMEVKDDTITAVNFEDATVETLLPERHMFMGSTWLCGKIVSAFGGSGVRGKRGAGKLMKYMMLSGLMKGREGGAQSLLPLMLLGGKESFLDGLFDPEEEEADGKDPDDD